MINDYPVLACLPALKQALQERNVAILQAPPGAGKSTVLPLKLLNEPWLKNQKIIMLEPRRLAARSVALRMAQLLEEEPGDTVGYRVRFESVVSKNTRIEVVTEGILTRMIQSDNALAGVGMIIFDEFHERSLQADLAFALTQQIQEVLRTDLRILIMSATLEGEKLSSMLNQAPVISSAGKQFPVTLIYEAQPKDFSIHQVATVTIKRALREQPGDVLVFLPGAGEISRVHQLLEENSVGAVIVPLFGDLPFKKQQDAILPHPQGLRKVVLATAIAETSLTIEGITTVIDLGFARVPRFDPRSGMTRLETVRVTRDAADQRSGRAGRLGPGVCYRLWSEGFHAQLQPARRPEILEADLASLMLELANWGINDPQELIWITSPPAGAISQAQELLHQLEALKENKITARGKEMLQLPTHPRMAHMLLSFSDPYQLALACDLVAILEEKDPLTKDAGTDVSLRVDILRKWRGGERVVADKNNLDRIERLSLSWRKLFKIREDNSPVLDTDVGRLLAEAYPERIAQRQERNGTRYKLANGRQARLPEHDLLSKENFIAIAQMDAGTVEGKIFLAAPLDVSELINKCSDEEIVKWDKERGMIVSTLEKRLGNISFETRVLQKVSDEKRIPIILNAVKDEGLKLLGWEEQHEQWQARVLSLKLWRPEEAWPDVTTHQLLEQVEFWLSPFLAGVNKTTDLQRLDLQAILNSILPWELQSKLEKLAPTRIEVPSGSLIKLNYSLQGSPPVLEARLQEMFGQLETPTINESRNQVLVHLLSPGYKPVQVTQDLKSFWRNTYHEVRKELRVRYPRHFWPEDPWTAEAVRGVKRKT